MPTSRGPQALSKELELIEEDATLPHKFTIAEDQYERLLWDEETVPAEEGEPGTEIRKTWDFFGGGMGETHDLQDLMGVRTGGYYFANNCQVSNPYAIRPRQTLASVTLTNNTTPVTQMFEAASPSGDKKLYAITDTKAHRVRLYDHTLEYTKDFSIPNVKFAYGSYVGNGTAKLIGPGWTVKFLIIKSQNSLAGSALKQADMPTYDYKNSVGTYTTGTITDGIVLTTGSIQVLGSSPLFNGAGGIYHWIAFGGDYVQTGKFSGDAVDGKDITVAAAFGAPDAIFIWTNNSSDYACFRPNPPTTDLTWPLTVLIQGTANIIHATASWPANGFQVGSNNMGNRTGTNNVFWVAMKESSAVLKVNSYTGTHVDGLDVTDPAFQPEYMIIVSGEAVNRSPVHRSSTCPGDSTMFFGALQNASNRIQGWIATGCDLGDADEVNVDTVTYYYLAVKTDPTGAVVCGQPAEWNTYWELPKGDDVDWDYLAAIADGTDSDTWTARTGLKATHFCVVENELVRGYSDRTVAKCSSTAVETAGNWTGAYNVGQPGTVITRLVNIGGECGVATTDGFYLWDTVSVSRQQLPLLAGIKDDDNGKGTAVVGELVLVPTADGLWRWTRGGAAQTGPDANRYYTESKGPTTTPIRLRHYDSAFLGTYVYNACYDGTNYHIIYTRFDPNHPTLLGSNWDFLLTTTNAVTVLRIDSDRRLWFNYGNDIAYIQLSYGGAPEGGTWGETSGNGELYLAETDFGIPGLKRLRLIELAVRNSATGFAWKAYVYRDGATVAQVGAAAGITTDVVGECFWTAGTSDTCRRLRIRPGWTASGSYTPTTTSPELYRVTAHVEPLIEDADLIVCSVTLDNPRDQKAYITAKKGKAIKFKSPVDGTKVDAVLYRRRYYEIQQKGDLPPIAACELRFRRSDTS